MLHSDVSSEDDGMSLDDLEMLREDIRNGNDTREAIRVTVRFRYVSAGAVLVHPSG